MKRNTTLAAYLLLVFVSGVLVGILGHRFYQERTVSAQTGRPLNRAEEFRRRFMSDLRSRTGLRSDQEQQVNAVLDETRERVTAIQKRNEPEMKAIREEQQNRIRGILDNQQRTEYNKMLEEREREREKQKKQPGK